LSRYKEKTPCAKTETKRKENKHPQNPHVVDKSNSRPAKDTHSKNTIPRLIHPKSTR
jgi:hypothetical protein